ncbi:methyltransferase domain-containing protein [Mucisphaera sp.]|uniref:methyltransferase domain-containing protein n=1 Tax=Mucisphaera sp. TaxID=2913024 RepID=UPI003D0C5BAE
MTHRDLQPELMDDPSLPQMDHDHALRGLRRINNISRVAQQLFQQIKRLPNTHSSISILDIATGSGDTLIALARMAEDRGCEWQLGGLDISPTAIRIAADRANQKQLDIAWHLADALHDPWPPDSDIVFNALFLHHLTREQAVRLLKRMRESARHAVIVSDLQRTIPGYLAAKIGTRLLSRSPIVHADGPQSVRAAWTLAELKQLAYEASYEPEATTIRPAWPQRMTLTWVRPGR